MHEGITPEILKETILAYIILKTDGVLDEFLTHMLQDPQFITLAMSVGLDTEKELLKILNDRIMFKLNKGDTDV